MIATTRAQRDPATKEYLARKEAQGETKKGALRSLKRHVARHFHNVLAEPPLPLPPKDDHTTTEATPPPHPRHRDRDRVDKTIVGAAPMPMVCVS